MKILIAEDDVISRKLLLSSLRKKGYDVVVTENGKKALEVLNKNDSLNFAILDWMMPEMSGVEVCNKLRQRKNSTYVYIILLTAKDQTSDIIEGLEAGADDYVKKPFNPGELYSRIRVGERILNLESKLTLKVSELQEALDHVKLLQGIIPVCMHCKRIRDDKNTWHQLEAYIENHSEAMFSHSLCKECREKYFPELENIPEEF